MKLRDIFNDTKTKVFVETSYDESDDLNSGY